MLETADSDKQPAGEVLYYYLLVPVFFYFFIHATQKYYISLNSELSHSFADHLINLILTF